MKTIAITGAAGRIGDAAARAFVAAGWRVRGIGRNARVNEMAPGVEPVKADIYDQAACIGACAGADVIFHAVNPPYDKWDGTVLAMMKNTLEAARASGATVLVPGNVYNYGTGIGERMTEDAGQSATTDKARIRIAMEELCRDYAGQHGVQVIVLRLGDYFGGPKPGSWLDLMILKDLKKDVFAWPGPMDVPHAFAYLPDAAEALVALAEKRDSLAGFDRFHFAGHTLTGRDFLAATEKAVGRKLKVKPVNWTVLRLVGLFMPVLREVVKMSYLWRTAHSLDGTKLEAAIGPVRKTPVIQAITESIAAQTLDGENRLAA